MPKFKYKSDVVRSYCQHVSTTVVRRFKMSITVSVLRLVNQRLILVVFGCIWLVHGPSCLHYYVCNPREGYRMISLCITRCAELREGIFDFINWFVVMEFIYKLSERQGDNF